jgi:hypothetical protein
VAARGSVLAAARAHDERVLLRVSFDGGATFAQSETFVSGFEGWSFRLAQVALGPSHELALAFWRSNPPAGGGGASDRAYDLMLVEGTPVRDGQGAPVSYRFGAERLLFRGDEYDIPAFSNEQVDWIPLVMGVQYSDAGDLVVGYGFTDFTGTDVGGTAIVTETRCLTRLAGSAVVQETLVEREDNVVGFDPCVALLGHGPELMIFVAYEASDGVRMRVSGDAGRTFSEAGVAGGPGAHLPAVFARMEDGTMRVDLTYIAATQLGHELHVRRWTDFGREPSRDYRLAAAGAEGELQKGFPGEPGHVPGTYVERQVQWFGYDATLDGDDVVLVYVEEAIDYYRIFGLTAPVPGAPMPVVDDSCGCVPPADPLHLRTLKLLRLD